MSKPGRNDPCLCGSGRKYKKCCLPLDDASRPRHVPGGFPEHFITELRPDLDQAVDRLLQRVESGEGKRVRSEIVALYEKHPHYHMTNFAMGVYQGMIEHDTAGSIPFFEKAVQILPPFPEAHLNLGNAARHFGDIPKAVAAYRMAERYSNGEDGIAELARKELRVVEDIVVKLYPYQNLDEYLANTELFDQAFQCLTDQQFEQAIELFERVLSKNPRHVQSYGNMGLAYAGLGQRAEAMKCLEKALEFDPDYGPALENRRVIALMREGEPSALNVLEVEYYADKFRASKASRAVP